MSSQVESIVNAYKQLSKIPSLVGARLNKAATNITSQWSVRNLDRNKTAKFSCNYTLDGELSVVAESDFATDISNELLSAVSPSERLRAVIREHGDTKETKKQYLEVWSKQSLVRSVDLHALELHGDVYADSEFKTLEWSPDESSIVYIAEKKPPKSEPFIKRKAVKCDSKPHNGGDNSATQGEEFAYRQDWGEQLVGKQFSVVALFTLDTETVTILPGLPELHCPGQVKWSPEGQSLVGVAWETQPRRLGLIFCTNRPSYIFSLSLGGQYLRISSEGLAVRSPRFVGDKLVWLQRTAGGPHHACHQIVYTEWPVADKPKVVTVLDIVADEVKIFNDTPFHGVYSQALPARCSASRGRLVFSTQQKRTVRSYVVGLEDKRLVDISDSSFAGSTSVLDVRDDVILASRTNMTNPSQLLVAKLPEPGEEQTIFWRPINTSYELPTSFEGSMIEYMDLKHDNGDSVKSLSAIYFAPASEAGRRLPLVVWPHGGPHSAFADVYSLEAALFNMMGFACVQVNYRGSIGDGQASVDFLPGRVGSADVSDCKMAADAAVERFPIDKEKICLFGGSHGGFLVTHMSGQYPGYFSSVVSRNPVVDVATMFNTTDIADWCSVEAGYEFTESGPVSEEQLLAMRRASPMAHVHKVKAPTALMLGSVDKRVPYYQGLEWYRRLKANGCITKLFLYEDNHSLSSIAVEMDNLINSILWFTKYTKKE